MLGLGLEKRLVGGAIVGVEGRYARGLVDIERTGGTSRNSTFFVLLRVVPPKLY